jgi:hypothetical protein
MIFIDFIGSRGVKREFTSSICPEIRVTMSVSLG